MQAIILLAGKNSRFFPLETMGHKAMSKINGKPIVEYVIRDFLDIGVKEIIVVTGRDKKSVIEYFSQTDIKEKIKFVEQSEPKGQGDAILKAKKYIKDLFFVANPYHYGQKDIFLNSLRQLKERDLDAVLPGIYEENIHNYGSLILDGKKVKGVVEKPENGKEPSKYRVTSAYLFRSDFIDYLEKEEQEEYSYENAYSKYTQSHNVEINEIERNRYIPTLKYAWQLFDVRKELTKNQKGSIDESAYIADNAIVEDSVIIDEGAKVFEGACIKGNTYIGKNVVVGNNAVIRDSDLGEGSSVGVNSDITRSIIMAESSSHGGGFIGDSIIGRGTKIAAGFITANKRTDRKNIECTVKDKKIDIGSNALGIICGQKSKFGINSSSMPGKLIGEKSIVYPSAIIFNDMKHKQTLKYIQKQEVSDNDKD